jgi:hypothetical protein
MKEETPMTPEQFRPASQYDDVFAEMRRSIDQSSDEQSPHTMQQYGPTPMPPEEPRIQTVHQRMYPSSPYYDRHSIGSEYPTQLPPQSQFSPTSNPQFPLPFTDDQRASITSDTQHVGEMRRLGLESVQLNENIHYQAGDPPRHILPPPPQQGDGTVQTNEPFAYGNVSIHQGGHPQVEHMATGDGPLIEPLPLVENDQPYYADDWAMWPGPTPFAYQIPGIPANDRMNSFLWAQFNDPFKQQDNDPSLPSNRVREMI